MNATSTNYTQNALQAILEVFTEFASNELTYSRMIETPCCIDAIINGFILKPKKLFPANIYPEIAHILTNLSAIDDMQILSKLIDIGLPIAVVTLMAEFGRRSLSVTFGCLDSLVNLFNCY